MYMYNGLDRNCCDSYKTILSLQNNIIYCSNYCVTLAYWSCTSSSTKSFMDQLCFKSKTSSRNWSAVYKIIFATDRAIRKGMGIEKEACKYILEADNASCNQVVYISVSLGYLHCTPVSAVSTRIFVIGWLKPKAPRNTCRAYNKSVMTNI